jgi:hypothetical protein
MRLVASGFEGRASTRYDTFRQVYRSIGAALPGDARLLLHTHHPSLGIDREVVFDWAGYQGLVSYAHVSSVPELVGYYRSLGVTHVLYVPGEWPAPSRKEEALFHRFVFEHATKVRPFGPYRLLEVPEKAARNAPAMTVATLGMPGYSDGLYALERMGVNEYLPDALRAYPPPTRPATNARERAAMLDSADAAFVSANHVQAPEEMSALRRFQHATGYAGLFNLYLRRTTARVSESRPARGAGTSGAAPASVRSGPER